MNVREINPPTPSQIADWSDLAGLQAKLIEAVEAMQAMSDEVGTAKTILEFSGERKKRALARGCAAAIAGGDSVAKAESESRASEAYGKELSVLQKEHEAAEQSIARWDVERIKWESCRSLISMTKETVKHL